MWKQLRPETKNVEAITPILAHMLKHLRQWVADVEGITNSDVNPSTFNLPSRERT